MAGIDGVGYVYVADYGTKANFNPYRGKEDFKPGLIFPEEKKPNTAKKVATGLGAAAAVALAVIFRGKIKAGALGLYTKVKPFAQNVLTKGNDLVQKGLKFAEPYYTRAKTAVTGLAQKVVNFFKKAPVAPTP